MSITASLASQSASYSLFGEGCAGAGGTSCLSSNLDQHLAGTVGNIFKTAILVSTGGSGRQVEALELITRTRSGTSATIPVQLYSRAANGVPGELLATTTMRVGGTTERYRATFSPPVDRTWSHP